MDSNIIKKANISADTQLVRNMNTALAADQAYTNEAPTDMTKVITVLHDSGYVVGNLNPTTEGYYYVWDSENNQIVFINDELTAHYPEDADMTNKAKYWATASTKAEAEKLGNAGYSIYLEADVADDITLTKWVSFDAGLMKMSGKLSISGTGATTIKTYGQITDLTVDNAAGSVDNYGAIGNLTITNIASACFNNYGSIADVKAITTGTLVNKAVITEITATSGKVDNQGYIAEIPVTNSLTKADGTTALTIAPDTDSAVIEVKTATELQNLAYAVNDGADFSNITIKLMNDIDLSGRTWVPFGNTEAKAFAGTIDGNGKTIKGLSDSGYVGSEVYTSNTGITGYPFGLISYGYGNITISNITINCEYNSDQGNAVGGFIGIYENVKNTEEGKITFSNCTVNGSIKGKNKIGGFIGSAYHTGTVTQALTISFSNCKNNASIEATTNRAGGFIGAYARKLNADSLTFTNCSNTGNAIGSNNGAVIGEIVSGQGGLNPATIDLTGVTNSVTGINKIGKNSSTAQLTITGE